MGQGLDGWLDRVVVAMSAWESVPYFDFEPETDLTVVEFVPAPDDADDW